MSLRGNLFLIWFCLLLASCSRGPARIALPSIDPETAGESAISTYDVDGDASLSSEELQKSPGLLASMSRYDQDGNGALTAAEIAARMRTWQERRMGMMSLTCLVQLDGRPLSGAEVRLVPDPFLGESVKPAAGTTNHRGVAVVAASQEDFPQDLDGLQAAQLGVYRVEITHPQRQLPEKYNVATQLGLEVAQDNSGLLDLVFRLKSR